MTALIKTRILIISDTHGLRFEITRKSQTAAIDVVIHCGDLTQESKLAEFRETIHLLQQIDAPLKLVIPGNHDFTLDDAAFARQTAEARRLSNDQNIDNLLKREYGAMGAARNLWNVAASNIVLLDEGEHNFTLKNRAQLKVYASPYTPSTDEWGFQYAGAHDFKIGSNIDIAITHGPPRGIMDTAADKGRLGCPLLFRAIAKARPRVHCFGHVHHGWGAKLVTWRSDIPDDASHFNSIDNDRSHVVESLTRRRGFKFETAEEAQMRMEKINQYKQQGYCDIRRGGKIALRPGRTLFVNAAMKGERELDQFPWLIEIDLQADEEKLPIHCCITDR